MGLNIQFQLGQIISDNIALVTSQAPAAHEAVKFPVEAIPPNNAGARRQCPLVDDRALIEFTSSEQRLRSNQCHVVSSYPHVLF